MWDIPIFRMNLTVAGIGNVGLSIDVLLAQPHDMNNGEIAPERVHRINQRGSPSKGKCPDRRPPNS